MLAGISPYIAANARDLIRKKMDTDNESSKIKPADSIHAATFLQVQADSLFTYDDRLIKSCVMIGIRAEMPHGQLLLFSSDDLSEDEQETE